jgi:hypothetical protein
MQAENPLPLNLAWDHLEYPEGIQPYTHKGYAVRQCRCGVYFIAGLSADAAGCGERGCIEGLWWTKPLIWS